MCFFNSTDSLLVLVFMQCNCKNIDTILVCTSIDTDVFFHKILNFKTFSIPAELILQSRNYLSLNAGQ